MPNRSAIPDSRPVVPSPRRIYARRPLDLVMQMLLASGAFAVAAWVPAVYAQSVSAPAAPATQRYDIAAGPLSQVLTTFSAQAGIYVVGATDLARGKTSPGLHGAYSVDGAWRALLAGTNFIAIPQPDGSWSLEAKPDNVVDGTLPAITVSAGANAVQAANAINPPTTVGSKEVLSAREIAQTVSVVTQQQIQALSIRTVDDAMKYAPGVTTEVNQPGFSSYYSRGFPISTIQFDGVPTGVATSGISGPTEGVAAYDRVEVLYGPSGILNGFGGEGGILNLVRKRAPSQFEASAQISAGTYTNGDVQADVGGPINAAGTLRGRFVVDEQYQHEMQDSTWQRNQQFYGTLEADVTPTTQVRAGVSYTDIYGKIMYGLPNNIDYTNLNVSRSTYLGPDWNWFSNQRANAFADVQQKLAGGWTAKLSYNFMRTTTDVLTGAIITNDPATNLSNRYSLNTADTNTQNAIDLYATGPFTLFGRTHHLTVGASYLHTNDVTNQYLINPDSGLDFEGGITAPLYDNSAYSNAFAGGPQNDVTTVSTQYGIYGNARFSLADPLTLVVGGRVTWWNGESLPSTNPNNNFFGNVTTHDHVSAKFSPTVGLIYDVNDDHTLYASYASIFQPQAGDETVSGQVIEPLDGYQFEIGEKGEYLGGRLTTNVALFHIREKNRAMSDPLNPGFYVAQGQAQSQGVGLRAMGRLTSNWKVGAGYTYTNWRNYDDSFTAHQGFSVVTPKHLFKFWTSYNLPDQFHRWTVGGALYVQSGTSYTDKSGFLSNNTTSGGTLNAGGYATVDANIGYQINKHLSASLLVTNLFNRKYISSLTTGGPGTYYGDPAKVLFTLRAAM
ncbi:outer membrane receptor for ferric coprogen and ferric-rhodotorulic acid [Paraburkholderia eburnea]|uniref:Outer membrane receptor for ferric coprogen and ferric-rhodotorulic acid n=2 Tax=Paraburkholderia eburnea TaxID=1189126 RepID=A0A2S4LVE1_9BURK|nr:outer membrane receptor for ferric coprogen and ferric-rhodotorulic acid [Paraburkholderia eburnea]PRZ16272.1 outer membrane receptor for ferric coprogen and ferric-rhodotorulic acid [Paraburkholderia eburnea]